MTGDSTRCTFGRIPVPTGSQSLVIVEGHARSTKRNCESGNLPSVVVGRNFVVSGSSAFTNARWDGGRESVHRKLASLSQLQQLPRGDRVLFHSSLVGTNHKGIREASLAFDVVRLQNRYRTEAQRTSKDCISLGVFVSRTDAATNGMAVAKILPGAQVLFLLCGICRRLRCHHDLSATGRIPIKDEVALKGRNAPL
ncbi:hypothetical protein F52700_4638 [Fusarium sp. NRRL 52700]|nr:hypothetical protein F52700_4638 [Fusarium sp. NRRL 52700]